MYIFHYKNDTLDPKEFSKAPNGERSSFDSHVFYMDDEIVATESESYLNSNIYLNDNSNSKAHVGCQTTLKSMRETMEKKDIEISKSLDIKASLCITSKDILIIIIYFYTMIWITLYIFQNN